VGAYLTTRKPVRDQWYAKRNRPLTGCTVLHTSESVMDTVGPDTGAESVAEFIRTRTTPGSYHDLVDSDSAIHLVEYVHGAYHDGTGSNNWALSIAFACRTSDWRTMSAAKRKAFLRQGAIAFKRQQDYRRSVGAPLTELRLITKAQSDAGMSGFTYHGLRDPGRRTDPGTTPAAPFPFAEFIAECRAVLAGEEDDMPLSDEDIRRIKHAVAEAPIGGTAIGGGKDVMLWTLLGAMSHKLLGQHKDRTDGKHSDDLLGFVLENNKHAWATRQAVAGMQAAIDTLATAAAAGGGASAEELKAAVREAMADVVKVEVSVRGDNT